MLVAGGNHGAGLCFGPAKKETALHEKRALIVGVTGIVGRNVAELLRQQGGWEVHGVSRRKPLGQSWVTWHGVDLLDAEATAQALQPIAPTHVFYCSWVLGRDEDENIRLNGQMLRSVLSPVEASLRHVSVVTGAKHYLGPFEDYGKVTPVTPFREDLPRLPKKNFYYELEDVVIAASQRAGFGWSVHRSHTIIGYAVGNLMNIGATLAAYATLCKARGEAMVFPGSPVAWSGLNDITDARLLAEQIVWAGVTPDARNEAFNAVNGDVFRWNRLWGVIADHFGVEAADYPAIPTPLAPRMANRDAEWAQVVARHGLQPLPLSQLASAWHTDLDLGRPMECVHSMAKARTLGFSATQDTEASFIDTFDRLRAERIIP
jgi:nucleoside-diphosphate-sugar epimerase